jgi:hypothetical protein
MHGPDGNRLVVMCQECVPQLQLVFNASDIVQDSIPVSTPACACRGSGTPPCVRRWCVDTDQLAKERHHWSHTHYTRVVAVRFPE